MTMNYVGTQTADPSCEETVILTMSRYKQLLRSELYATALDQGGVDNWEWYGESLNAVGYWDEEE